MLILPGTVLVFVPAGLLYAEHAWGSEPLAPSAQGEAMALSLLFFLAGLSLAITTVRLFVTVGQGTPAPWHPPKELVIRGPYRFVRNPMITGVLLMLAGEALFFSSALIFGWMAFFLVVNMIYLPLFEEKDLIKRFGAPYLEYKKNVPRWLPRLTPYTK